MINLALAVCCSLALGMIFKLASVRELNVLALVVTNYVVAVVALIAFSSIRGEVFTLSVGRPLFFLLGAGTGVIFVAAFLLFAEVTKVAGMSLAISVYRVAVIIPFCASWMIWGETPSAWQGFGLALAMCAFFLITHQPSSMERTRGRPAAYIATVIVALFLSGGLGDLSMKTFDAEFSLLYTRTAFMTVVFITALAVSALVTLVRGNVTFKIMKRVIPVGIVLGLANIGSAEFLLRAIRDLDGPFVYPVTNVGILVGGALLGVVVWKESLSRVNWLGIVVAGFALVLLSR